MQKILLNLFIAVLFGWSAIVLAQTESNAIHIFTPDKMKWSDGPASLPKGAQITVLEGDPKASGPFTIRVKFPANFKVMPHVHEGPEHVTVISGAIYVGQGDKFDEKNVTRVDKGSFGLIAPGTQHFGFTKSETILQLHGMGPWVVHYVNSADDPRKS
jgi:quercetin dioxygenase-like cupin family protein